MSDPRNLSLIKDIEKIVRLSANNLKDVRNSPMLERVSPGITEETETTHRDMIAMLEALRADV